MARCYSCHEKNSEYICARCGIKVCENCSIYEDNDIVCSGCVADEQDKIWELGNG